MVVVEADSFWSAHPGPSGPCSAEASPCAHPVGGMQSLSNLHLAELETAKPKRLLGTFLPITNQ